MSTLVPALKTTCSVTSTAAGWRTLGCPPTAPPTAAGAFRLLADRAEEQVRDIITEAAAANAAEGTDPQRIGDLYASFMDTETIAGLGVRPLLDELAGVDAALTPAQLTAELGELQRTGIGGGTGVYVDTDSKDSTRYLVHLSQSGLGLPDESYYRAERA